MQDCKEFKYDVVLSFAGEDRKYVEKVAKYLFNSGVKVFYDIYEDVDLWGKDLYQHLDDVYQNKAKYAVIFVSEAYGKKLWANHELKSAQARAFSENEEYILPARFDNTEITGLRKTIGYVDLSELTPTKFAKKVIRKLGDIQPENFLPDNIDFVIQVLQEVYEDYEEEEIESDVASVFEILKKTSERERHFLSYLAVYGCRHNIEEDLHEDITLFERVTGFTRKEIVDILNSLSNIGYEYKIIKSYHGSKREGNRQKYDLLKVAFSSRRVDRDISDLTPVLALMFIGITRSYCESCSIKAIKRLDFSNLQEKATEEELEIVCHFFPMKN